MPRRRRSSRPVRRPNFRPAPEGPSRDAEDNQHTEELDEEAPPSFADEPVAPGAQAMFGASGPVETRPHWVARNERAQGRRMAQLRRSAREDRPAGRVVTGQLPTFERTFINDELRRIAITTVALTALLVVLALVLR